MRFLIPANLKSVKMGKISRAVVVFEAHFKGLTLLEVNVHVDNGAEEKQSF
jgi:hypothetical protein